ncbi:MAG TPA: hypothetical protein VGM56_33515 [Byssovorax sp.]|jgi:hypothetical protein
MSEDVAAEEPKSAGIDFETAAYAEKSAPTLACSLCKQSITTAYFHFLGKVLCHGCRAGVERSFTDAKKPATFAKAAALAGVVAVGCGGAYAVFVGFTNIQFALVTIGIGWAIGRTIQKTTRGFGSRRHQVLAVALTYFASSMGYLPALVTAIRDAGAQQASATPSTSPAPAKAPPEQPADDGAHAEPPAAASPAEHVGLGSALGALVKLVGFVVYFLLVAPFYEIADGIGGIIGLFIIFFGLRTAWKVSKGVGGAVTGPHQATAAAP